MMGSWHFGRLHFFFCVFLLVGPILGLEGLFDLIKKNKKSSN